MKIWHRMPCIVVMDPHPRVWILSASDPFSPLSFSMNNEDVSHPRLLTRTGSPTPKPRGITYLISARASIDSTSCLLHSSPLSISSLTNPSSWRSGTIEASSDCIYYLSLSFMILQGPFALGLSRQICRYWRIIRSNVFECGICVTYRMAAQYFVCLGEIITIPSGVLPAGTESLLK
jgi:hypothetical protein